MPVALRQLEFGVELAVKASPGSRSNEIRGVVGDALKISVTAAPEKGKANKAIVKLLAKELGIAKSQIELTSGATSPLKKFLVLGVKLSTLEQRLAELISE